MGTELNRRRFIQFAAGSIGVAALGGTGFAAGAAATSKGGGGATATRNALRIPPTMAPQALTAQAARVDLGGGHLSNVLAYNGLFPGPTFAVDSGNSVAVTLNNKLADATTIHWHGLVVPTVADGQPHEAIPTHYPNPYTYAFTVNQRAAFNFYHPHPHLNTGSQVYHGLAGAFIVRDTEERSLGLPGGTYEAPLVIRDASFDSTGNLTYGGKASGFLGNTPLVNGTLSPYLAVDRGVYRFRVLNSATARIFRLALANGGAFTIIGNDGGLLPKPISVTWVDVSPAERLDLLIDFSALASGQSAMLRCLNARWDLLEFRGTDNPGASYTPPTTLSSITPLVLPAGGTVRRFSFDGMTRINGKLFSMDRIDFQVPAGVVEKWTFVTNGNAPHPVHVHGASFQVVARRGGRAQLFPWEAGWKDTVLLNDREEVDVLIRFDPRLVTTGPQRYLIHCHKLEHEDAGMMSAFRVT
jgi:FtsP/CotA-like multicopper oxidase with cupredoxin domain